MAFKNEIDMEEKTEVLGENPILAPLRARQNKKWLPLDRTWDSVDKDRRLTACVGNFWQKAVTSLYQQQHASQPSEKAGVANQVSVLQNRVIKLSQLFAIISPTNDMI